LVVPDIPLLHAIPTSRIQISTIDFLDFEKAERTPAPEPRFSLLPSFIYQSPTSPSPPPPLHSLHLLLTLLLPASRQSDLLYSLSVGINY